MVLKNEMIMKKTLLIAVTLLCISTAHAQIKSYDPIDEQYIYYTCSNTQADSSEMFLTWISTNMYFEPNKDRYWPGMYWSAPRFIAISENMDQIHWKTKRLGDIPSCDDTGKPIQYQLPVFVKKSEFGKENTQ